MTATRAEVITALTVYRQAVRNTANRDFDPASTVGQRRAASQLEQSAKRRLLALYDAPEPRLDARPYRDHLSNLLRYSAAEHAANPGNRWIFDPRSIYSQNEEDYR